MWDLLQRRGGATAFMYPESRKFYRRKENCMYFSCSLRHRQPASLSGVGFSTKRNIFWREFLLLAISKILDRINIFHQVFLSDSNFYVFFFFSVSGKRMFYSNFNVADS